MTVKTSPSFLSMAKVALVALIACATFFVCIAPSFAADYSGIANVLFPAASEQAPASERFASLLFGLFIGVMLTAAIYLFFIWIVIRDRGQVFLMLLLVCLGVNMASTNELLMNQIGPRSEDMRLLLQNYSLILSYIFSVFFTLYFLEIDDNSPVLRGALFIAAGGLFLLLVYSSFDQRMVNFALPTLCAITIFVVLLAGAYSLRLGISGSLTHITAFLFFLVGGLAKPMYEIGLIANFETTNQLTYTAYSLAALMFAIVISSQFAARQEEKEHELALSNERFALAAKGSNEGLFDWNIQQNEIYFSDQFRRIIGVGLTNGTNALKSWVRHIYPPDRKLVRESLRHFRINNHGTTINLEYRVIRADQQKRWVHMKAVATRNPQTGKLLRLVGSVGDITSRKQGEVALRASELRFRSITEANPVPVMIISLGNGHVLYASPGAELLLGMPHSAILSHSFERFLPRLDERNEIAEAIRQNHEVNLKEVNLTKGDGNVICTALSARRITYQNELAMVIGLYDLTESKEAQSKIAVQQEALQQSEKMAALGGLLAGVAHELNNPLSVVVGQATLLIEGSPEAKVTNRAEKIFKAADRCSRIVKSFLAIARRKPPEHKPVQINTIITSSLELLGYQLRNENIELKLDLQPDLPEITGDGDQMTQVFTNLELNAAQAMQEWTGKRSLTIKTEAVGTDVRISVIDTGPGIPADLRKRVFEPFFTTKGSKGGTGVGLALCINIIEGHGGKLVLEDTEGGGASFLITLPTLTQANEAAPQKIEAGIVLQKMNILLVDDEPELVQTLADLLEPEGHQISMAANGAIALEKLHKEPFDIIISDLRMPVMDGPTMYTEMGRTMPFMQKRIIYVTGDTLSTHIQSFLSQNSVPVIEKPYRLADVKKAIASLLKENDKKGNI